MISLDNRLAVAVVAGANILSSLAQNALALRHVARWHLVLQNTGVGAVDVTALAIRRRPTSESAWGPWEVIAAGLPLADGETISIRETADASSDLDVRITSAGATTVSLWIAGSGL